MPGKKGLPNLAHFKRSEFRNPDLVDTDAANLLDLTRGLYNRPLILTDDARKPGECPPGCSPTSLHYEGRAFDLRWNFTAETLAEFVGAVYDVERLYGAIFELELVYSKTDKHVHLAFKTHGQSEIEVRAE